jgi:hypothetical protein
MTAEMERQERTTGTTLSSDRPDLSRRYAGIGIPAVAAAARYQNGARNPAKTPARTAPLVHEDSVT